MAPSPAGGVYGGKRFAFTEVRLEAARKAVTDRAMGKKLDLLTTQRMGAVRHARREDCVPTGKDAAWTVPKKWMKGHRSAHRIPLANVPQALEILRERRAAGRMTVTAHSPQRSGRSWQMLCGKP